MQQPIQRNVPPPPLPLQAEETTDDLFLELAIDEGFELRALDPRLDDAPAAGLREAILRFLDEEF